MARLSPILKQATSVNVSHGLGVYLYDTKGRPYLDFTSGVGATSTGHCHPRVVAAVREQTGKLIHGQYTTVLHNPLLEFTELLGSVLPDGIDSVFYMNSGSEAVEAAVRLARHASGRQNIVAFQGGFHGRTAVAVALSSAGARYRCASGPLPGSVALAPFPNPYRSGQTEPESVRCALDELDYLLDTASPASETAAFIIEPVLGEGGYVPVPSAYLRELKKRAVRHGILLILDEIQTGAGRTGKFWAHEHAHVEPDIIIAAKGIASGFPISMIAAPESVMGQAHPGSQGGTYGGNAVACAAGIATVRVIKDENLELNARTMGDRLHAGLKSIADGQGVTGEVRGVGLMQAMEFSGPKGSPDPVKAGRVRLEAERRGLLILTCGSKQNVIRMIPPLIVTAEQIDEALRIYSESIWVVERTPDLESVR